MEVQPERAAAAGAAGAAEEVHFSVRVPRECVGPEGEEQRPGTGRSFCRLLDAIEEERDGGAGGLLWKIGLGFLVCFCPRLGGPHFAVICRFPRDLFVHVASELLNGLGEEVPIDGT